MFSSDSSLVQNNLADILETTSAVHIHKQPIKARELYHNRNFLILSLKNINQKKKKSS